MNPRETAEMTAHRAPADRDLDPADRHDMRVISVASATGSRSSTTASGSPRDADEVRHDPRVIEAYLGK
jgi:hypothetical protein